MRTTTSSRLNNYTGTNYKNHLSCLWRKPKGSIPAVEKNRSYFLASGGHVVGGEPPALQLFKGGK